MARPGVHVDPIPPVTYYWHTFYGTAFLNKEGDTLQYWIPLIQAWEPVDGVYWRGWRRYECGGELRRSTKLYVSLKGINCEAE